MHIKINSLLHCINQYFGKNVKYIKFLPCTNNYKASISMSVYSGAATGAQLNLTSHINNTSSYMPHISIT